MLYVVAAAAHHRVCVNQRPQTTAAARQTCCSSSTIAIAVWCVPPPKKVQAMRVALRGSRVHTTARARSIAPTEKSARLHFYLLKNTMQILCIALYIVYSIGFPTATAMAHAGITSR